MHTPAFLAQLQPLAFAHARRPSYTVEDMERTVWHLPDHHWLGQSPKETIGDRQTIHPPHTHRYKVKPAPPPKKRMFIYLLLQGLEN